MFCAGLSPDLAGSLTGVSARAGWHNQDETAVIMLSIISCDFMDVS